VVCQFAFEAIEAPSVVKRNGTVAFSDRGISRIGWRQHCETEFVRTSKHGIWGKLESWSSKRYRAARWLTGLARLAGPVAA
jgi:hypothetical protein